VAVAANGDDGAWPVPSYPAHQTAQMSADLLAVGGLAGTQYGNDAMTRGGVVDMDRQKAALVVMGVEQRQLLVAVHGIGGVIDIQGDGLGRTAVALAPQVDHAVRQSDQGAQVRRVLPA
jgi:hypothetical protein